MPEAAACPQARSSKEAASRKPRVAGKEENCLQARKSKGGAVARKPEVAKKQQPASRSSKAGKRTLA